MWAKSLTQSGSTLLSNGELWGSNTSWVID